MFFLPYTLFDHMGKHAIRLEQSHKLAVVACDINCSKVGQLVSVNDDGNGTTRISLLYDNLNCFIKTKEGAVNVVGIKNFTVDGSLLAFIKHVPKKSRELLAFRAIYTPVEQLHRPALIVEMSICSV